MIGSRAWDQDLPLSEVTFWVDWDSTTQMILSLRQQLFEHGSVPVWNFTRCGGQPELAVTYSWAYTWPSVFAYALPPIYAALLLWAGLALVGFFSTRALLHRWSGDAWAATLGALVYALCGLHATRFNAGHMPFAFLHLVPLLMLLFEISFARTLSGERSFGSALRLCLGSFLFMSAALPHPLIHFYPALLLLVAVRVIGASKQFGARRGLRAAGIPLAAHAIGAWIAAYKVWPMVRWQLEYPREGVHFESYGVGEVLWNTLRIVPEYGAMHAWRGYPEWEYNAFVGPLPWLLALLATALLARRMLARGSAPSADPPSWATGFGLLLLAVGFALSVGNDTAWSPAVLFRHLPVFEGIRAFARFQILIVFALAILTAEGLAGLARRFPDPRVRRPAIAALTLGIVAPLLVQTGYGVWNIRADSNQEIFERYDLPPGGDVPQQVWNWSKKGSLPIPRHSTALLERNYWVANCMTNLTLPRAIPDLPFGSVLPVSNPPPESVEWVGSNQLRLRYPPSLRGRVWLNLRILDSFDFDAPVGIVDWRVVVDAAALTDHQLTITARYPGPREGAMASAFGLVVGAGFFVWLFRRERGPSPAERH